MARVDDITGAVQKATSTLLESHGYDLVLVEFVPHGAILRLYVDHPKGVSVDDCQKVSGWVSDILDAEGISERMGGRYHLEVSSPGLDRPLTRPKDFERFVGSPVQLSTKEPLDGRRRFQGDLVAASADSVELVVDGRSWTIAYGVIERARLVPKFD